MQRFTISLDDDLAEGFDRLIAQRGWVPEACQAPGSMETIGAQRTIEHGDTTDVPGRVA